MNTTPTALYKAIPPEAIKSIGWGTKPPLPRGFSPHLLTSFFLLIHLTTWRTIRYSHNFLRTFLFQELLTTSEILNCYANFSIFDKNKYKVFSILGTIKTFTSYSSYPSLTGGRICPLFPYVSYATTIRVSR